MYLKNISFINFKNYDQAKLQFSSGINCFIGNNGVGKTNLLDAIFYLSFCKSYFSSVDSQSINHNADFLVIQGTYFINESNENIYCGIKRFRKKQFKRNKKEYNKLSDHIGLLPLVMISPVDINLIIAGSEERRKYINFVISQYDKLYLEDVIKYNRALRQRNILLKDFSKKDYFDEESLEVWNDQLISLGDGIYKKRVKFINDLLPIFRRYYDFIASGKEEVEMIYQSQLHGSGLRELLHNSFQKDRILQYTTTGIHKDDLLLKLGGYPIKEVASQGQKKTYLISLKLAQFDFIKQINGFSPVLLLDDIFDKFDSLRVEKIIKLVSDDNFGQIFITDTMEDRLEKILTNISKDYKLFRIGEDGIR